MDGRYPTLLHGESARPRLALLLLAWALAAGHAGAAPRIEAAPNPVRQGDCIIVTVRVEAPAATRECRWNNATYPLFPMADGYRAILPVSPDMPSGSRPLVVVLRDEEGKVSETSHAVTVRKRDFGVQSLRMSTSTTRLYSDPSVPKEREAIHEALSRLSADQAWRGSFVWPVKGRISTGFGLARAINGEIQYRHRGLDIAAPAGTPIVAAADGVVTLARDDFRLHGKTITLDHGHGVSSLYLHLSEILVREGRHVTRGQVIGKVGSTGAATGPHLHWAVYVANQAVEPQFWLDLPEPGR